MNKKFVTLLSLARPGRSMLLVLLMMVSSYELAANSAPERLRDPARVATFYAVTARINCQCSCHDLLGECPHIDEDCFGVQTRRFVETRILEGMDEESILAGFVSGFGDEVRADRQLRFLAARGREDLVNGYVRGFGAAILHTPPSPLAPILIALAVFAVFALLVLVMVHRSRRALAANGRPSAEPGAELELKVRQSIDRLER